MEKIYQNLLEEAKKASEHAYSPYSKFSVGACVLYENEKKYTGCNVENASYGLSLCAERNAISNAISQISPEMINNFSKMLSNAQEKTNSSNSSNNSSSSQNNSSNTNSSNISNFDFSGIDMNTILLQSHL